MTNTSDRPISVDGVRLDTLAWNIEKVNRSTASRRSFDVSLSNLDGALPSMNDALEPVDFGLQMWLRGTDDAGAVPVAGSRDTFRANLDQMLHLFGTRHRLLEVTEQVSATESRRAFAKVTAAIAPDLNTTGTQGTFSVALSIPAAMWEDVAAADVTLNAPVAAAEPASLFGGTERINDAVYLVTGPATTPRITDPTTGMWVELGTALSGAQFWRFNSATWSSRYGAGLGLGSSDTTGTDGGGITAIGGPSRAYGLPLVPVLASGSRRVRVTLSAASGISNGVTKLSIRARRKYAA